MAIKQNRALRRSLLLCLLLGQIMQGLAQTDNIRSIEAELPSIRDSTAYVDAINRLAMLLYEQNADSTAWYAHRAREIAARIDYKSGIADATNNLGVTADVKGNIQTALHYYNDAYNDYAALNDSSNMVQTLMNIATVYSSEGKSEKAIEHFDRAFAIGNRLKHDSIVSLLIYNYLLQYPGKFSTQTAADAIEKAVNIATRYHDTRLLLAIEQLKANNQLNTGSRDSGIARLQRTAAMAQQQGLLFMSLDILVELGDLFVGKDSARAVGYYKHALEVTEEKKFNSYAEGISQKLFDFYSARKDTALAFYYSRKVLTALIEKQGNDRKQGFDYIDYAIKDQELATARQRSAYNGKLFWLASIGCAMAIAIIFILWRNARLNRTTHLLLQNQYRSLETAGESLQKSNRQYTRLLKVVAHDLRNPIGAIHSAGKLMLANNQIANNQTANNQIANNQAAGKQYDPTIAKLIDEASSRCLQLIGELLQTDFEIKPDRLKRSPVVTHDLLQPAIDLMQFRAKDKNQSLILKASSTSTIQIDKEQMTRVLDNLLANAIKFSPEYSTITVAVEETNHQLTISVRDQGIGIPPSIAGQLFDPFTSAKRKGTAGEQTYGLGLYICKQIMEAHGGRIWFDNNTKAKGAVFFIQLPVAR
jgi:signal transduction histidine kinase